MFVLQRHHCHYGSCPPCHQRCDLPLPCGHPCPVSCHDNKRDQSKLLKVLYVSYECHTHDKTIDFNEMIIPICPLVVLSSTVDVLQFSFCF